MKSVLTSREKQQIRTGLVAQGADLRDLSNGMIRVLSPDGQTQFTMSQNSPSSVVVSRDRSRVRKMGLVWPLDPEYEKPRDRATLTERQGPDTSEANFKATVRHLFLTKRINPETIDEAVAMGAGWQFDEQTTMRYVEECVAQVAKADPAATQVEEPEPTPPPVALPVPRRQAVESDVIQEWIDLTPDLATQYLEHNVSNRSLRAAHVATLARDMAAGRWRVTGDSIKFDTENRLVDGQHRLHAVVESGATIRVLLILGVEPEAQAVIDTNARRNASDALTIEGHEKNVTALSAATRVALARENGYWMTMADSRTPMFSNSEILSWIADNPGMRAAVELARQTNRGIGVPVSIWAYCLWVFMQIDLAAAGRFAEDLTNFKTEGQGDPLYALLMMFQKAKAERRRITRAQGIYYVFRTWNAWRAHEPLAKFAPSAGARVPDPI